MRNSVVSDSTTTSIDALRYFNRLVVFAQRESDLEASVGKYEMAPILLSLFSEKNQLMNDSDKAAFVKALVKGLSQGQFYAY